MNAKALLLALASGLSANAAEVRFAAAPEAKRVAGGVEIRFAAAAPTDAAVYIENAKGEIVRHLVAGVLGRNPPPPLKGGSLSQTLLWDGKDDRGRAVEGDLSGYKVRVGLGLGARYDKIIARDPTSLERVSGLGTAPDGTLYVLTQAGGAVWRGPQIIAFHRDGSYRRTLTPFPASLTREQVKGFGPLELDGRPAPLLRGERMALYPGFLTPWPTSLAVSPGGKTLYVPCGGYRFPPPPSIGVLNADGGCPSDIPAEGPVDDFGGCPAEKFAVPIGAPGKRPVFDGFACIAVSSDGRWAFVGGLRPHVYQKQEHCAVFRVPLPGRRGCEPFFGDPAEAGKDETHLGGAPRGLAVDGQGRLFVADRANDRVVIVSEKDGRHLGQFAVEKPDYLGLDPKTGGVYVARHPGGKGSSVDILKFAPGGGGREYQQLYKTTVRFSRAQYAMAVDASARRTVIWTGAKFGKLLRIEDTGTGFAAPRVVSPGVEGLKGTPECYLAVVVDRRRKEIYTRNSPGGGLWYRYCETTDKLEKVFIPGSAGGGGKGFQVVPHPDGNLYGLRWPYNMLRWDRSGKPLAWAEPIRPTAAETPLHLAPGDPPKITLRPHQSFVPVSMVELPHTLGVRDSDGHLFAFAPARRGRLPKVLHEYLPTGRRVSKDPIIWKTTDAVVGPKFDPAGNIYVAEVVTPKGWLYPPELKEHFRKTGLKGLTGPAAVAAAMYGSIVKFGPGGGTFEFAGKGSQRQPDPFEGRPKLPAGLKRTELEYYHGGRMLPAEVVGAEWVHPGIGHVGLFGCNCENVTVDVDGFGRVFFPDLHRFRVRVIDTSGNALTHFGGYGNAESSGPDSPVIVPAGGPLRPPRPGEKLRSPFAVPAIALAWPVGVGVTDGYAYVGDSLNRRLLRVKLVYAAEATCPVR